MVSAARRNSLALRAGISHGSTRISTAAPVMRSTGFRKAASSLATMMSVMQASITPAATHLPCTAAMVGLRKSRMRRQRSKYITFSWCHLPSGVSRICRHLSGSTSPTSAFRSCPAEKCLPLAASTTTRTSSSASARSNAASISSIIWVSWALATCGRFMVMVATGPSTS